MANGEIHEGGEFKGRGFGDGCIFINCLIRARCTFGKGCVFVDCAIVRSSRRKFSQIGDGAVLRNCYVDWAYFESAASFQDCNINRVALGPDCVTSGTRRSQIGKEVKLEYKATTKTPGASVSGGTSTHDWCSYKCKVGRYVLGKQGNEGDCGVELSGEDEGKQWSE